MEEVIISINGKLTLENLKSMLSDVLPVDSVAEAIKIVLDAIKKLYLK